MGHLEFKFQGILDYFTVLYIFMLDKIVLSKSKYAVKSNHLRNVLYE